MPISAARSRIVALAEANRRIAVHACLDLIFTETVKAAPKLIVELGVSLEALANKALVAAAELFYERARVISCDIYDFSGVCDCPLWSFYQGDAREIGRKFRTHVLGGTQDVDVLLIDCDEKYDTTREIIRAWMPNLSPTYTVMFRCTNLAKILHYADGTSTGLGWDNDCGVIRAVEDEFGISFDETKPFEGALNGWSVKHIPWGAGLTALRRPA